MYNIFYRVWPKGERRVCHARGGGEEGGSAEEDFTFVNSHPTHIRKCNSVQNKDGIIVIRVKLCAKCVCRKTYMGTLARDK